MGKENYLGLGCHSNRLKRKGSREYCIVTKYSEKMFTNERILKVLGKTKGT